MGDLRLTRENIDFMLRVLVPEVDLQAADPDEGKKLTTIALYHRLRGITRHLATGAAAPFAADLSRAVQARRLYLERLAAGKALHHARYGRLTQNRALFDAVAIGDLTSAAVIARLGLAAGATAPETGVEALFLRYLHELLAEGPMRGGQPSMGAKRVATLTTLREAGASPESLMAEALEARDGPAFSKALLDLVEQRRARFAADLTLPPEIVATEPHVFVLGLALVRIAQAAGTRAEREYPTIPSQVLGLTTPLMPEPDAWRSPA